MGECIAHLVNAAALVDRLEYQTRSRPQLFVIVSDDKLHAPQAAIGQRAEKADSEGLGFGRAGGHPQHLALAVLVHRNGHYRGMADDPPAVTHLQVSGIEPQIGPVALQRLRQERVHPLIYVGIEAANLALRHAACAHGLHQVVRRARQDASDESFLDHRQECFLGYPTRFKEAWQVASLPQLRDLQRYLPGAGVLVPLVVSIPLDLARRRSHVL